MNFKSTTLKRLSACTCGYTALHDSILLGTEYQVDFNQTCEAFMRCGGCAKTFPVTVVYAATRIVGGNPGYMPLDLFIEPRAQ